MQPLCKNWDYALPPARTSRVPEGNDEFPSGREGGTTISRPPIRSECRRRASRYPHAATQDDRGEVSQQKGCQEAHRSCLTAGLDAHPLRAHFAATHGRRSPYQQPARAARSETAGNPAQHRVTPGREGGVSIHTPPTPRCFPWWLPRTYGLALAVCWSRVVLTYHSVAQTAWGLSLPGSARRVTWSRAGLESGHRSTRAEDMEQK